MADSSVSPNTSVSDQAFELVRQNAADARQKQGLHVKLMSKAEVTAALSPVAASAATAPTDSVQSVAAPTVQTKSVVNSEAPHLPDPTGPVATPSNAMRVVKGSDLFASGGDNLYAALEATSDARQRDINLAQTVKRDQGLLQISAKTDELKDKEAEIAGQKLSAATGLVSSMFGIGATLIVSKLSTITRSEGGKITKPAAIPPSKADTDETGASGNESLNANAKHAQAQEEKLSEHTTDKNFNTSPIPDQNSDRQVMKKHDAETESETGTPTNSVPAPSRTADSNEAIAPSGQASPARGDVHADKHQGAAGGNTGPTGTNAAAESEEDAERKVEEKANRDSFYRNIGQNMSSFVDSIHKVFDVDSVSGGQYQANQANLAQKEDNIRATIAQTNVDSASGWVDAAKEQRKGAQQAIVSHFTMWTEALNNVFK